MVTSPKGYMTIYDKAANILLKNKQIESTAVKD
jgi:hypothetical protein